jgi:hypothetical protein
MGKREAFHTLYDVPKAIFPFLDQPADTALLIVVGNATITGTTAVPQPKFPAPSRRGSGPLARCCRAARDLPLAAPGIVAYAALVAVERRRCPLESGGGIAHLDISMEASKVQQRFELIDRELALARSVPKPRVGAIPMTRST